MSKPENISQVIWDEADAVGEAIHGRHERGWVSWPLCTHSTGSAQHIVALALSQAYSRGLEDAARVAAHLASLAQAKADDKTKVMADFDRYRYDDIADELNFAAAEIRAIGSK